VRLLWENAFFSRVFQFFSVWVAATPFPWKLGGFFRLEISRSRRNTFTFSPPPLGLESLVVVSSFPFRPLPLYSSLNYFRFRSPNRFLARFDTKYSTRFKTFKTEKGKGMRVFGRYWKGAAKPFPRIEGRI
jgi:hypothetical protein